MFERRLSHLYLALAAALLAIAGRLAMLQVFRVSLEDPDRVLYPPEPWQSIEATRGLICDRDGNVLVGDRPCLDLAVDYQVLRFPRLWLRPVREATGLSEEALLAARRRAMDRVRRIRRSVSPRIRLIYEETIPHVIAEGISLSAAARIEAAPEQFPGVTVRPSFRRDRPGGDLARHVIGYLGTAQRPAPGEAPEDPLIAPGDRIGISGVEKKYDALLRGAPGAWRRRDAPRAARRLCAPDPLLAGLAPAVRDRLDREMEGEERIVPFPAQHGRALFLTLHSAAQRAAERALAGREGGVVVMDVHTGEVLVLASAPADEELNRATQDSVAPGSVIKPLVALAAAMERPDAPALRYTCARYLRFGGRTFRCDGLHGEVGLVDAIAYSCNIYFWTLGQEIGPVPISRLTRDLGWGSRTGIDLPYEWPGYAPTAERAQARDWYPGSTMNLSIGQGSLRVTPLQVAVSMAAIANGGTVLEPRLLLRVVPEPGLEDLPEGLAPERLRPGPRTARRVALPEEALRAVREGMRGTVTRGTAARAEPRLRALDVAAKTGTAETGDRRINHAWLAGYAPFDNPRYAFAVVIQCTPEHGGEAAGPPAADVLAALMNAPTAP